MSAKPVTYYQAQCDCCGAVCDDYGDFSAWSDPGDALDNMPEAWQSIGGHDFCEDCWEWSWHGIDPTPLRNHEQHPAPGGSQE